MAAPDIQVGRLAVPVVADLRKFDQQIKRDLRERAQRAARTAGNQAGQAMASRLEQAYRTRMARAKLDLHSGAIDQESFAKRGREAAEKFNQGLTREINRLRKGGVLSASRMHELTSQYKSAGRKAGEAYSDGLREEAQSGLQSLRGAISALLGLQVLQIVGQQLGRVTDYLRGALQAGVELAQSYLKLAAASKLFGVEQSLLNGLAQTGISRFKLNTSVANEMAVQVGKLAAKAEEAAKSQELYARALDLGAAQGMDAAEVAVALEQTLRGLDEGTDKLLQKNPQTVYDEYAAALGRTGESLTDVEQKQALLNAVMEGGLKVQGAYNKFIESDIGSLAQWERSLRAAREEIGNALLPVVVKLADKMSGPLATGVKLVTGLLEGMLTPTERLARQMEQLGLASEYAMPLALRDRIKDTKKDIREFEAEIRSMREGRFFGSRNAEFEAYGEGPALGELSTGELQSKQRELHARLRDAIADEDIVEQQAITDWITRIDELLVKERELVASREELAIAEEEYQRSVERRDLRMQLDQTEASIAAIEREGGAAANLAHQLQELYETKARLEKELGIGEPASGDSPEGDDPGPTEAELKRRAKEREQLKSQARQIRAEMETALAGLTATMRDEALLQLSRLEEEARKVFRELGQDLPQELADGYAARRQAIEDAVRLEELRDQASRFSEMAPTPENLARMEAFIQTLIGERNALEEGSKIREEYNELIRRTGDAYADAKKAAYEEAEAVEEAERRKRQEAERAEQDRIRGLRDQARSIEENVRGVLQLAEAFGMMDSEAAQALESVVQLGTSIARIAGGDLSAIPAAIGSLAQLGGQIFGESDADRERKAAMQSNTEALNKLRLSIEGYRLTADRINRAETAAEALLDYARNSDTRIYDTGVEHILRDLYGIEMTGAQMKAIAEDLGITLFDKEGFLIESALDEFIEALGLAREGLTGWADTLDAKREEMELEDRVYGRESTPQTQLEQDIALLTKFAPEMAKAFEGLDLTTEAGQEEARRIVQEMYRQFQAGELNLEGLTREEFLAWVDSFLGGLEGAEEGPGGVTGGGKTETRMAVNITEAQANQHTALFSTMVYRLTSIDRNIAALAGVPIPSVPVVSPPSPASMGLTSAGSGSVSFTFSGDVTVQATADGPADVEGWRQAGRGIVEGMRDGAQDLAAEYRAHGLSGPQILTRQNTRRIL